MSKIDTGGNAFPIVIPPNQDWSEFHDGMTLRDWFAGMAMQAMARDYAKESCTTGGKDGYLANAARETDDETHVVVADVAYHLADALIAEKRRTEGSENDA